MSNLVIDIIELDETTIYGLWRKSNDRMLSSDIKSISEKYYSIVSLTKGSVLPYFILSRNYDEESKDFDMLIGGIIENKDLDKFHLPEGRYAKITVKPKLGFLWGAAIGDAKKYFYTKWLPSSQYQGLNMEYEYHTEKSKGKHPSIDIIFAIKKLN